MRITLVIGTMGGGGAERVMSILADYWAQQGVSVTLITLAPVSEDFYNVNTRVRRVGLGLTKSKLSLWHRIWNNLKRVILLRRAIRASRPDCIVSFLSQPNVVTLVAGVGMCIPVIVSEHIDPRQMDVGKICHAFRRFLYPRAAAVVILTEGVREWAEEFVDKAAVRVIPNPIPEVVLKQQAGAQSERSGHVVAAMGRLDPQKGFDVLLKAFARCTGQYPDWSMVILGEGGERSQLEALARKLGIADRVSLPGLIRNPFWILRAADLFVLSSRFEGFPMALIEAMSCRLPVISTDCPSGPRDIVRDGVDAVLVPIENVEALAEAMSRLMGDPNERDRLGARAAEIGERFSVGTIIQCWNKLLAEVIETQGRDAARGMAVYQKRLRSWGVCAKPRASGVPVIRNASRSEGAGH